MLLIIFFALLLFKKKMNKIPLAVGVIETITRKRERDKAVETLAHRSCSLSIYRSPILVSIKQLDAEQIIMSCAFVNCHA